MAVITQNGQKGLIFIVVLITKVKCIQHLICVVNKHCRSHSPDASLKKKSRPVDSAKYRVNFSA